MVIMHGYPPPPPPTVRAGPPAASVAARPDLIGWCIVRTWLLIAIGSAFCSLFAMNVFSIVFVIFSMPIGLALGIVVGLPVAVPISWWLSHRVVGPDPAGLVRTVRAIGATIAVVVNGATNIALLVGYARSPRSYRSVDPIWIFGFGAAIPWVVAASGLIGWMCGDILAKRYLMKTGHPASLGAR